MKKMYYAKFYTMLLLALVLAACSSKKSDIAYYIPNNAAILVNIDMGKMHEKGKLAEFDKTKMYTQAMSLIALSEPNVHKVITEIMANSAELGLELKGNLNFYMNDSYLGLLVPMKNKEKYVSFVKKQADAFGAKEEPHKLESFLAVSKDNAVFAWNDDVLYYFFGINNQTVTQVEAEFKKIVTQKEEESIIANKQYKEFAAAKKDISMMMNFDNFMKIAEKGNSQLAEFKSLMDIYKGFEMNTYVEFANDEIIVSSTQNIPEELKKMFDPSKISKSPISDKLLKLFPSNSIAAISIGMNPNEAIKGYQELIKMIMAKSDNTEESAQGIAMINMVLTQAAPYLNKLDGEILVALTDLKKSNLNIAQGAFGGMYSMPEPPMPAMGIALGVNDNTILDQLITKYQLPIKKEANMYKFPISDGLVVYAVNANNVIMFTNDEALANATIAGQMPNNLTESPYKNELLKGTFAYMNLNPETYPNAAKEYFAQDSFLSSVVSKLNGFEAVTIDADYKKYTSNLRLKLKKSGMNSFYSMLQMIEKSM